MQEPQTFKLGVRDYNFFADYRDLAAWWAEWGLPVSPPEFLTHTASVVEQDGEKICAGFLYQLGSSQMWWIEGIVSNPKSEKEIRRHALYLLIQNLTEKAQKSGAKIVMTSTPRESLAQMFEESGFKPTPEKYFHYGRHFDVSAEKGA